MFLDELPGGGRHQDLSTGMVSQSMNTWRSGGRDADAGWHDAGVSPRRKGEVRKLPHTGTPSKAAGSYVEGMTVRHDTYGMGRITEVSGCGRDA